MRRIDKKLNIIKNNILAESRYLENKFGINEHCESGLAECYDNISEEEIEEETTDESLKRDTSKSSDNSSEPSNKKVVGSDNFNAFKKDAKAGNAKGIADKLKAQATYSESEDDVSKT